jgi:tetratricopeptide (TPR) repeat protein
MLAVEVPILRGQLIADSPTLFRGVFVSMQDVMNRTEIHRVDVGAEGNFIFRSVPTGDYLLRVTDLKGQTIHEQYVTIQEHMGDLAVRLTESERRQQAPGTISLNQLTHPPSKKAVQAFAAATRLSESGKYDAAAAELEKAVQISPEFASAYTNLAVQQIRMHRFQDSAASSKRAIEIAGPDPLNLCNLAFAQYQLEQYDNAIANARAALRFDSGYPQAHLIVGSVLARDPAARAEAIQHLELAADKFESARKNLELLRANR